MQSSGKPGKISLATEVVNISPFGVWILVGSREYFLDHKRYPWFKEAAVEDVLAVKSPRFGHISWPSLDIDLHLESLENPEHFPLIASHVKPIKRRSSRKRKVS